MASIDIAVAKHDKYIVSYRTMYQTKSVPIIRCAMYTRPIIETKGKWIKTSNKVRKNGGEPDVMDIFRVL